MTDERPIHERLKNPVERPDWLTAYEASEFIEQLAAVARGLVKVLEERK